MVADHFNGSVVYAALHTGGLFKSRDGGGTWTAIGKGLGPYAMSSLALDATNPLTLYAADGVTLYRSVDGGLNFTDIGAGTPLTKNSQGGPALVAVDRANPGVLYAASNWVAKSTDGGSTWQMLNTPGLSNNFVQQLDVDPVSSAVYMSGYGGLQKSTDAGATWSQISGVAGYFALSPSGTLYTSTAISTLRSDDGGATWKVVGSQAPGVASQLAADPTNAGVIYTWSGGVYSSGAGFEAGELYQHKDAASEWQILSGSLSGESAPTSANINHITAFAAAPSTPGRLYYAASPGSDAFVAKIDPTGAKLLYATYLGGLSSDSGNAIAVDTAGNAYVTGATASADFPVTAGSFQPVFVNLLIGEPRNTEGFVAKLDPSGAHVVYSSYLGGSSTVGRGLALDRDGSALVGGSTVCSTTFPAVADGFSINNPFLTAFISRVFPDGSQLSYSTCFGGMGGEMATGVALDSQGNVFMTGIGAANMTETPNAGTVGEVLFTHLQFPALTVPVVTSGGIVDALTFDANRASPGSVVSVFGTGFAFGATQAASFPLTTKLGGVSATIDGIAAPLFYAGPNQINLQVPWEVQPGTSHMVMTNASGSNVPAAFPVQTAAPAIAIYPTTHHAIAFNQDQTLNSSANPAPAQSVVTLYLIGQGPVSNTPATGAPAPSSPLAMATLPASVSLGAAGAMDFPYPATLMYLGLAPTWVGLAQANVQLPDVPPGDYRLQLTVGGAASNVVTISVGAQ